MRFGSGMRSNLTTLERRVEHLLLHLPRQRLSLKQQVARRKRLHPPRRERAGPHKVRPPRPPSPNPSPIDGTWDRRVEAATDLVGSPLLPSGDFQLLEFSCRGGLLRNFIQYGVSMLRSGYLYRDNDRREYYAIQDSIRALCSKVRVECKALGLPTLPPVRRAYRIISVWNRLLDKKAWSRPSTQLGRIARLIDPSSNKVGFQLARHLRRGGGFKLVKV